MITFLGRTEELAILDKVIASIPESQIVTIYGAGGIGKTRLLREIRDRYLVSQHCFALDIVDFDLPAHDFLQMIGSIFTHAFPEEFQAYTETLYLHQRTEEGLLDAARVSARRLDVETIFIQCVNAVTAKQRIVLLFDTVEKITTRHSFELILQTFAHFKNIVLVFAGRQLQKEALEHEPLEKLIRATFDKTFSHTILLLAPFDHNLSQEYIQRKQSVANLNLDHDWQRTLALLAKGRPVVIDLAVDLGLRSTTADWIRVQNENYTRLEQLQKSTELQDKEEFQRICERFDRELVGGIGNQHPLDQLAILLCYVAPLTSTEAEALLGLDGGMQNLFSVIQDHALFKLISNDLITLHDVAYELLVRYILPEVDSDGERKYEVLQRAIELFNKQSKELVDQITELQSQPTDGKGDLNQLYLAIRSYQGLHLRIAEYKFRLDPLLGVDALEEELKAITQYDTSVNTSNLAELIQTYLPEIQQQSIDSYWKVQFILADAFVRSEQYDRARAIYESLEPLLQKQNEERRAVIAHRRGAIEMGSGDVYKALEYFRTAAALAERVGNWELHARALLSCGWASRAYGTLFQPVDDYKQALRIIMRQSVVTREVLEIRATALNGMSYVSAIEKKQEARELLSKAIEIRRSFGVRGRFLLAQSYSTAGEVYNELDEPHEALKYLELAEQIIKELDRTNNSLNLSSHQPNQWLGKIYSARGRAYSALWEKLKDSDIGASKQYLVLAENTLLLAERLAIAVDLPRVVQRLGFVYAATSGRHGLAIETWERAYKHARDFGDIFMEFNTVGNLAYMASYGYSIPSFPKHSDFGNWYADYLVRSHGALFNALQARFDIYRGALALQDGDSEQAYVLLNQGLTILESRHFDRSYGFHWQLVYLKQDISPRCSPDVFHTVMQRLANNWMEQGIGVTVWDKIVSWYK